MALIDAGTRRIYFDANIFIYTVEKHREYAGQLACLFEEIEAAGRTVVTSELTLAECLVGARKTRSPELENLYETLLAPSEMIFTAPVDREILRAAARHAGDEAVKLPDAIHIVTATVYDCGLFLTNDRRIKTPPSLSKLILADIQL